MLINNKSLGAYGVKADDTLHLVIDEDAEAGGLLGAYEDVSNAGRSESGFTGTFLGGRQSFSSDAGDGETQRIRAHASFAELLVMGYPEDAIIQALKDADCNINAAAEILLNSS